MIWCPWSLEEQEGDCLISYTLVALRAGRGMPPAAGDIRTEPSKLASGSCLTQQQHGAQHPWDAGLGEIRLKGKAKKIA